MRQSDVTPFLLCFLQQNIHLLSLAFASLRLREEVLREPGIIITTMTVIMLPDISATC